MDAVKEAFRAEPRTGFLPEALRSRASFDGPLDIGHGQTSHSQGLGQVSGSVVHLG